MLTAAQRRIAEDHVAAVARRGEVRVRRTKRWTSSEADISTRQVFIPKTFYTALDYLVALHELAHILHRSADTRGEWEESLGTGLRIEAAAWGWAIDRARPEIMAAMTKSDRRRMGLCWASHSGPVWPNSKTGQLP